MDKSLLEIIVKKTNKKIKEIVSIPSGNSFGSHCKVIFEDGNVYLAKHMVMKDDRLKEYQAIQELNIASFQKTFHYLCIGECEYIVFLRWETGKPLSLELWNEDPSSYLLSLQKAAKTLWEIHTSNEMKKKIDISPQMIERVLNKDFLTSEQKQLLRQYINKNLPEINSRYITVIHGDLHINNILMTEKGIVFIDLDDTKYGDAYMDLVYAANIHYSRDLYRIYYEFINFYFNYNVPTDFWRIVNIYSIYKAILIMDCEIKNSRERTPLFSMEDFIVQHDGMKSDVPVWYQNLEKIISGEKEYQCGNI